ncbi:MAG: nucleotidyltransferase family protein [Bacteroidales bacterium]|nr:nucleotidyltransferase family protein [Bacteroidales bacterium]
MKPDRPYIKLLTALCRTSPSAEQVREIAQIIPTVENWHTFTRLANEHGISAMVWHNLERMQLTGSLPEKEQTILKQSFLTSLTRNTYLTDRLAEAVKILARKGIDVVLLKGMALELSLYGNAGLRQMNDVDLLISPNRCMEAWRELQKHGYVAKPFKSPLYRLIALHEGKHLPELRRGDLTIEIHHTLFPEHPEITEEIITGSTPAEINGQIMLLPPPHLHFLYLLKHMQYHELEKGETQLRLYADLLIMAEKYRDKILNGTMAELARKTTGTGYLEERLYLLQHFWGTDPGESLRILVHSIDKKGVEQQFRHFLEKPKGNAEPSRRETLPGALRRIPGVHRKTIHLIGEIFPSLTFMKNRYNTRNRLTAIAMYPVRWYTIAAMALGRR